ncbi:MAG TPA: amidohydrolase family protein [Gemmatimonadaceae bacterium]|nr:amidohydrolase family protein [Gemmatimonadaceae bacterium]
MGKTAAARALIALLAALAALPAPAAGQGGGAAADVPILVRDVTLIDGTGAAPRPHMDLVLRGGRIAQVAATGDVGGAPPDSVIDGRGLFAIPGLIDAHVHLGTAPWSERADDLRHALMGGVTTVFDLAGDARATGDLQRAELAGQIEGPRIYYVALFGGPAFFTDPRTLDASRGFAAGTAPWMQAVTDSTDFARAVALARGTGAVGIKLYAALDSVAVTRATAEAHRQGLRVIAHATTFPARPGDLVAAGADMLAHTPYLVWQGSPRSADFPDRAKGDFLHVPADAPVIEQLLRSMRDRGVALNPTLWVFAEELPRDSVSRVRSPWMYAVTRRAAELGVRIVAGTDGMFDAKRDSLPTLHRELELLVTRAGLTPLQAITAATENGAWAIGVDRTLGTLVAGKAADLVLLGADPTADIRNTRAVRVVIQRGKVVRAR